MSWASLFVLRKSLFQKGVNQMAWNSGIGWCHHTFNAWVGCSEAGYDCFNCYARLLMQDRFKRVQWGEDGTRERTKVKTWAKPVTWDKKARLHNTKFLVFGNSLNDILEDRPELEDWRFGFCQLMKDTPNLIWILLTKRPENFFLLPKSWQESPPDNVWFGLSVGDAQHYYERAPAFYDYFDSFSVRVLSLEPLIGPIEVERDQFRFFQWVYLGGESEVSNPQAARYMNPNWMRYVIEQCRAVDVSVFVKQMGTAWASASRGKVSSTPFDRGDKKGERMEFWPRDLRIREWPEQVRPYVKRAKTLL